jgi:hypothetical protein
MLSGRRRWSKVTQKGGKIVKSITIHNWQYPLTSVFFSQAIQLAISTKSEVRIHRTWEGRGHPSPQS